MRRFFYIDQTEQQVGPCSLEELAKAGVRKDTMVWYAGIADWTPAGDLPELDTLFAEGQPAVTYPRQQMPPSRMAEDTAQDNARRTGGGERTQYPESDGKPDSWLTFAIIATVLCCPPFGIPGIVYAAKVDVLWTAGRYDEAEKAAKSARMWTLVSVGVGFLFAVIWTIAQILLGVGLQALSEMV